jgi:hypothetical protein
MKTLRPDQALVAVSDFIEIYVSRVNPPEHFLGDLLGDIQFLADGNTADPASRHEWLDAVERVTGAREDAALSREQAFDAMRLFVEDYRARIKRPGEVEDFLKSLQPLSAERRNEWLACVGKASNTK